METSTFWWVVAGITVAAELMSGTFYLLMIALGLVGAALAASAGASLSAQIAIAAVVGGGAVVVWRSLQLRGQHPPPAQANPDVNLDVGQIVQIDQWNADGSANVHYRGAHWTAIHRAGIVPTVGEHRVAEVIGARLLVDKT
ncbi:MAG: NfeD family protein [Rhodoferax sp.]|nr:NfeD family protein [Rhodoferax sp.]